MFNYKGVRGKITRDKYWCTSPLRTDYTYNKKQE